ncbi:hypothetical protein H6G04_14190 [Calothrix membranacea FACHB-236]|nr:hypothetical protein [Calothrix membranacea FACHB-236]
MSNLFESLFNNINFCEATLVYFRTAIVTTKAIKPFIILIERSLDSSLPIGPDTETLTNNLYHVRSNARHCVH